MPFETFGLIPPKAIAYIYKKVPPNFSVKRRFRTILKGMKGRINFKTNAIVFTLRIKVP